MSPENHVRTRVIVGSMNMGYDILLYIYPTLPESKLSNSQPFRPKCAPIPLGRATDYARMSNTAQSIEAAVHILNNSQQRRIFLSLFHPP